MGFDNGPRPPGLRPPRAKSAKAQGSEELQHHDEGWSTCPICQHTWKVTAVSDCLLPACGCYGDDYSAANRYRPCEPCGLDHAIKCMKARGGSTA